MGSGPYVGGTQKPFFLLQHREFFVQVGQLVGSDAWMIGSLLPTKLEW